MHLNLLRRKDRTKFGGSGKPHSTPGYCRDSGLDLILTLLRFEVCQFFGILTKKMNN